MLAKPVLGESVAVRVDKWEKKEELIVVQVQLDEPVCR